MPWLIVTPPFFETFRSVGYMISRLTNRLWLVGDFLFDVLVLYPFLFSCLFIFVPFRVLRFVYSFWSHEIDNYLYSDGRSFSPEKISHDIFRTQLVCLTLRQKKPFIGVALPITNCAQGMLDIVCLGVTCDDMPDQSVLLILLLTFAIFMWLFFGMLVIF